MMSWNLRFAKEKYANEICGCGGIAVGKDSRGYPACKEHEYSPEETSFSPHWLKNRQSSEDLIKQLSLDPTEVRGMQQRSNQDFFDNLDPMPDWKSYPKHPSLHVLHPTTGDPIGNTRFIIGTCGSCGKVHEHPIHQAMVDAEILHYPEGCNIPYDPRGGGCIHQNNAYGQWDYKMCAHCGSEEHNTNEHRMGGA